MPATVEAGGAEDPGAAEEPGDAPATVEPGEPVLAVFAPSNYQITSIYIARGLTQRNKLWLLKKVIT